jgi:hypothetical protein
MSDYQEPELMTQKEYVEAQTAFDRVANIEGAGSLFRVSEIEAAHLQHVRTAVYYHRDIHPENRSEYKTLIPQLCQYGLNGNRAVFDRTRKVARLTVGDIELADYLARKRRAL